MKKHRKLFSTEQRKSYWFGTKPERVNDIPFMFWANFAFKQDTKSFMSADSRLIASDEIIRSDSN